MSESFIALVSALAGGTVLELLRRWYDRQERKRKEAEKSGEARASVDIAEIQDTAALRHELWNEIGKLRDKLDAVQQEGTQWRDRYWQQQLKITEQEQKIQVLERENEDLRLANENHQQRIRVLEKVVNGHAPPR